MPEETVWLYRKTQTCDTAIPTPPHTFVFNMPLHFYRSTLFYSGFLPSAVHAAVLQFGTHSKSRSVSHTSPSLLPDWFSHSPGPLPTTTATQLSPVSFMVGMHTGLLWLRIELWESFAGSGQSTTASLWEDEQLTWKKISTIWECGICVLGGYVGAVHGSDWLLLQRETLVQIVLVRPHVFASLRATSCNQFIQMCKHGFNIGKCCSVLVIYHVCSYWNSCLLLTFCVIMTLNETILSYL